MALPCLAAAWMLAGFYLPLGPSLGVHLVVDSVGKRASSLRFR